MAELYEILVILITPTVESCDRAQAQRSVSNGPKGLGGTGSPVPAVYGYKTRSEAPGFPGGPNPNDWLASVAALSRA